MLNIKHDHFYGSQEKHDLQLIRLELDTTDLNEAEALENGWLIYNKKWYASRSTRIDLNKYRSKGVLSGISYNFTSYDPDPIDKIYKEYKTYKKFEEDFNIHTDPDRSIWLIAYDEGVPVAFTKFIKYDGGLESQFTCWNYHKPKMSLGKKIVDQEVEYARSIGLNYLYIGQGYEKGSAYKADYPGFEWWTGKEWSTDLQKYREICARDSSINTIEDIARVYNASHYS
jgi:hypothetical protein